MHTFERKAETRSFVDIPRVLAELTRIVRDAAPVISAIWPRSRSLVAARNENDCVGLNLADSLTGLKGREGGISRGARRRAD